MNWSIFQNFPQFEQKLDKIFKIWENQVILLKNWSNWLMNGSLFVEKLVHICMGLLSISAHSYQNQTGVPPT